MPLLAQKIIYNLTHQIFQYFFQLTYLYLYQLLFALHKSQNPKLNRYSVYGALATAHFNRKNYRESKEYLSLAFDIYYGEPPLIDLEKDLEKKLK